MKLIGGDPEEFEPREAVGPATQPSCRFAFSIFTYRVEIPYRFRKWPAADFFVLTRNALFQWNLRVLLLLYARACPDCDVCKIWRAAVKISQSYD